MPAAIVAAMAIAEGTAAYYVAYFAVSMAISYATSALLGAVFGPSRPNGFSSDAQGRTQVVRSAVQPRNIIYGQVMTSGPLVFVGSTDKGETKNGYLHLVIALVDHEIEAIDGVYFNDVLVPLDANGYATDPKYKSSDSPYVVENLLVSAGKITLSHAPTNTVTVTVAVDEGGAQTIPVTAVTGNVITLDMSGLADGLTVTANYERAVAGSLVRVKKHLGSPTQAADPDLVAECGSLGWTTAHTLSEVAYLYVRLEYDTNAFPTGIPNIKALVRGKKVYDPRTNTTVFTQNWALCVYDYLRDARGFGCNESEVDEQSVIAAANICDEMVQIGPTASQRRYWMNGVAMSDRAPRDVLKEMSTAAAGAIIQAGGIFRIHAGSYDTPTVSLTENDLRGSVKVRPRLARRDLFNVVSGTYVDGASSWQPVNFPQVSNALYATQDGETIQRDIQLPYTTEAVMSQRLAKIILERSRQGITVDFPAKLIGFKLQAWDTVSLSIAKFGWTNKVFRVADWKFSETGGVDLTLQEEAASVYAWNNGEATTSDSAPDTNLPNPAYVPAVMNLTADASSARSLVQTDGTVIPRMLVTWSPVPNVVGGGKIEVQYKRSQDTAWSAAPALPTTETQVTIQLAEVGQIYVVRARVVTGLGVVGAWTYANAEKLAADSTPPGPITNFSATPILNGIELRWTNPTDADFDHVEVYEGTTNVIAQSTLRATINGSTYVRNNLKGLDGPRFYWLRAVDTSKNAGPFAGYVTATARGLLAEEIADGILNTAKFAQGIQPVGLAATLPNPTGYTGPSVVFNTADGKLYRLVGGAWTAGIPAADITGTLSAAQTGVIDAANLTGQITATQIADGAISTPKLAAGAVSTANLAAGAVTAGTIAAAAITTEKLAAGAVTASNIAANTITSNELSANSVTAGKIAAGAISTTELAAGAVNAQKLAASNLITLSAQIANGIIGTAQIGDAQVDTLKIGGAAVTVPVTVFSNKVYSGTGNWQVITAGYVYLNEPGIVSAQVITGQTYGQGVRNWLMWIEMDGEQSVPIGGEAVTVAPVASMSRARGAGWHEIKVKWWGADAGIRINSSELSMMGAKR